MKCQALALMVLRNENQDGEDVIIISMVKGHIDSNSKFFIYYVLCIIYYFIAVEYTFAMLKDYDEIKSDYFPREHLVDKICYFVTYFGPYGPIAGADGKPLKHASGKELVV
jgi:hypothetical protein